MRDTTFTLQALHYLDLGWEADEFMQFVADLEPNEDGGLQIMYGIDGRRDLTESTRDDLSGYARRGPNRQWRVRPAPKRRLRRGARLDLASHRRSQRLPRRLWPIVQSQAECATSVWRQPDQGIWEARGKPQRTVSSKLMSWVALDRAEKPAGSPVTRRWRQAGGPRPRRSRPTSCSMVSPNTASCVSTMSTDSLDASTLLAAIFGFLPDDDERLRNSVLAIAGDRERIRPPLPNRRDRRRLVRKGGHVPDLFLLARVRTGDHR